MTGFWIAIASGVAVTGLVGWRLLRPHERFALRIEEGIVMPLRGEVDDAFITDVQRICRLWGISEGTIRGIGRGQAVRIHVSGGIPPEHARAFQNAWDHPL